jgi:hypothetical protein
MGTPDLTSPLDLYDIHKANRELVYQQSIKRTVPDNKFIREALGWRELPGGGSYPRFESTKVKELSQAIHGLKDKLLGLGLEEIDSEWRWGHSLQTDIVNLLHHEGYGEAIWGSHSEDHLNKAEKDTLYSTDLCWRIREHRD